MNTTTTRHNINSRVFLVTTPTSYAFRKCHHLDFLNEWLTCGRVPAATKIEDVTQRELIEAKGSLIHHSRLYGSRRVAQSNNPHRMRIFFPNGVVIIAQWCPRACRWTLRLDGQAEVCSMEPLSVRYGLLTLLRHGVRRGKLSDGLGEIKIFLAISLLLAILFVWLILR